MFRTLVDARVDLPAGLSVGAELMDSRAVRNGDVLLNTTIVNSVELLRAYIAYTQDDVLGGRFDARAGRITMDVGSRRFVARNRYRNTINGFTGLDLVWKQNEGGRNVSLRGFWTLPVRRAPDALNARVLRRRLLDNDIVFDRESLDVQFWGLFGAMF